MASYEYLAGLFDGEGTIGLYYKNKSVKFRMPQMTLPSTTMELLVAMQEAFGGYIHSKGHKVKEHHKDSWVWSIQSSRVLETCEKLYPHILEPSKKHRMRVLLETYPKVTPRNGKYTPEMLAAKLAMEDEFFVVPSRAGSAELMVQRQGR